MPAFVRTVEALSRVFGVASAAMIVVAVAVVCQMVFVRYVLGGSTVWQTPFVTYVLISATFLGSPYVLLVRGHVNVDLVPLYLGHRGRLALAFLAAALSLGFCLVVTWYGAVFWYEAYEGGWKSSSMWRVDMWIPYLSLPLGFALLSLQYVADILSLARGRDMPFGLRPDDRP